MLITSVGRWPLSFYWHQLIKCFTFPSKCRHLIEGLTQNVGESFWHGVLNKRNRESCSQVSGDEAEAKAASDRESRGSWVCVCVCVQWVTVLLNSSAGPDSGTEVWPSVWWHGILLPVRNDSPPLLSLYPSHSHYRLSDWWTTVDQGLLLPQASRTETKLTQS